MHSKQILCNHNTIEYDKSQEKLYDKICQKMTEINIPTRSAISAATNTNLIFLTPTILVYTAIVYKVVSVDPIIVDTISPILLSTPYVCMISVPTAIDALPEIGLNRANGIISLGILNILVIGTIKLMKKSIIPELLNNPIATNIPTKVGNNLKII